jgi:diadenosine tetraphosphate (Ap4A) HIT family hydrolase
LPQPGLPVDDGQGLAFQFNRNRKAGHHAAGIAKGQRRQVKAARPLTTGSDRGESCSAKRPAPYHSTKPMSRCVYDDKYFTVIGPVLPLNCREDGGHLILIKKEPVSDRSDLCYREAIDFMRITMIVGRAMYDVLNIERMNYEDLGNWGLDDPGGAKMHLHFFGRAREQVHQIRGQHMFLYPKDHKIYQGHLKALNDDDLVRLKARIDELVDEPKYQKMAELAEL